MILFCLCNNCSISNPADIIKQEDSAKSKKKATKLFLMQKHFNCKTWFQSGRAVNAIEHGVYLTLINLLNIAFISAPTAFIVENRLPIGGWAFFRIDMKLELSFRPRFGFFRRWPIPRRRRRSPAFNWHWGQTRHGFIRARQLLSTTDPQIGYTSRDRTSPMTYSIYMRK